MSRLAFMTALSLLTAPAFAQHQDHNRPRPPPAPTQPAAKPAMPADEHNQGERPAQPQGHAGHVMNEEKVAPPESGNAIPPDHPTDHAADVFFPRSDMERARRILEDEHGGALASKFMFNEFEYTGGAGDDGYRWDGEAWFGGDVDRLVLKSEGEGERDLESAEVQTLYSRAVGPYTDLQFGLRHDIEPSPSRTYLAAGFESVFPYWFEADGALFLGERGQVLGRFEGSLDFMLTQRLVLQPTAELNFAVKDEPAVGIGSGVTDSEVGLRLRYEIRREFAPYLGILWERKFGDTADLARASGDDPESTRFVAGLRGWF